MLTEIIIKESDKLKSHRCKNILRLKVICFKIAIKKKKTSLLEHFKCWAVVLA